MGYVLAPLLRDSLSAAEQAALQERRIALIAAAERRNRLGFKVLTPKTEVVFDAGTLRVRSVAQSGQWVMDRYDDTYHYRDAVRGSKFVVADVSISSEIHDPRLPAIGVYRAEGNSLRRIGAMHYEFYRWRDFGSYLGNYADYGNDFAHSSTIRFSPGVEVSEQEITGAPVFILVGKAGCVTREHARFGNPEISYSDVGCSLPYSLNLDQAESGFVPIRIFGRDLL